MRKNTVARTQLSGIVALFVKYDQPREPPLPHLK